MSPADPDLVPLPPQPEGVPWPTDRVAAGRTAGSSREPRSSRCSTRCATTAGRSPPPTPWWSSIAARIVAERYQGQLEHFDRPARSGDAGDAVCSAGRWPSPCCTPSSALLVGDGLLDLDAPADVPEWSDARRPAPRHHAAPAVGHARRARLRRGLRRRAGLRRDRDAVRRRAGRHGALRRRPTAGRAARARASTTPRGRRTSSRRSVARVVGHGAPYEEFLRAAAVRVPSGCTVPSPSSIRAGTWVASSYRARHGAATSPASGCSTCATAAGTACACCPKGGSTTGAPSQSVDPEDGPYGAHWWGVEGDTLGTFRASGYEGQSITICPTHDLVVVRLGKTAAAHYPDLPRWRADAAFRACDLALTTRPGRRPIVRARRCVVQCLCYEF